MGRKSKNKLSSKYTECEVVQRIDTPKEERIKHNIGNIFLNKAECIQCNEVVQSFNKQTFNLCKCGQMVVAGGSWYKRRIGVSIDRSVMFTDLHD